MAKLFKTRGWSIRHVRSESAVWRPQQRWQPRANLLALLLAARANPPRVGLRSRKTAATSRRTPNAGATAKSPRLLATPVLGDALKRVPGVAPAGFRSRIVPMRLPPKETVGIIPFLRLIQIKALQP